DARLAAERGVDLLFAPTDAEMYPAGEPIVRVSPGPLGDRLCGAFRPGHFVGVLTVVAKLFNIVQPDVAVFGQKDYQQAVLIRRMAVDLDMPIEIVVAPLVREPDGLAMSSRNAYLTGDARERARSLYEGLTAAANAYRNGERSAARLAELVRAAIEGAGGRTQYVELVAPDTLAPLEVAVPGSVLAVAAFVDGTRLIDNIVLTWSPWGVGPASHWRCAPPPMTGWHHGCRPACTRWRAVRSRGTCCGRSRARGRRPAASCSARPTAQSCPASLMSPRTWSPSQIGRAHV